MFVMQMILAHALPEAEYSAFMPATSIMTLLAMMATMGTPFTLVRVLRSADSGPNHECAMLRGALVLTIVGCIVTCAIYYAASGLLPDAPKWHVVRNLPGLMSAWFSLSALCIVGASYLQGVDDFFMAALVGARNGGVIPNCLAAIGVGAAAVSATLTLQRVMAIQVVFYLVALVCAAWAISRYRARSIAMSEGAVVGENACADVTLAQTRYTVGWYLAESWPNLLNQVMAVALIELDGFWVVCLADEAVVAHYAVVRNLRLLVTAPLLVASVALAPFVAELYGRGELRRLERMLRGAATALAAPSLVALLAILVAPRTVIDWTFGAAYADSAAALQIASLGCIIFVLSGSNGLTLTMTGRHRDLMVCSLASLGLYFLITPFMVGRYGVNGAAMAFAIQMAVQNIVVTLRVKQTVGIWTIPLTSWAASREEARRLWRQWRRKE